MNKKILGCICIIIILVCGIFVGAEQVRKDNRILTRNTFTTGRKTVTTAGVPVAIDVEFESISIKALSGNSGKIYIGEDSDVDATNSYELDPGDAIEVTNCMAPNGIYVDAATNGDGICYARLN